MNKDWLNIQSQKYPDKIFLRHKKNEVSFKDFNDIVYDKALSLVDFGIKNNNKVVLLLSNPIDFIEAYLACYKIGAITIIFNHTWKDFEINQALEIVKPDYIVCSWNNQNVFKKQSIPKVLIEELSKSYGSCYSSNISNELCSNDIQSILFTSGTKGVPKPVCLTYDNFYKSSLKWKDKINLGSSDNYILALPLFHIGGLAIIMRSLHIGFSVDIVEDLQNKLNVNNNSSIISLVPTMLKKIINNKVCIENLKKLKCIILSGSNIQNELLESSEKLNLNIFISYGMTESCSSVCGFWPFKEKPFIGSVGQPFNGVDIYAENNKIIIKSDTIMHSYYGKSPHKGILKTEDLGYVENGYTYINGRNDNILISGGENIDQAEVVNAIYSIGDFNQVIPYKKNDPYWGEVIGVKIISNEKVDANYIKRKLNDIISKHKIPKEIIVLTNEE